MGPRRCGGTGCRRWLRSSHGWACRGFLRDVAWAQYVAVPSHALASLPDAVTFARAATLPVAGLTALYALAKRGQLLRRRVLITGATAE